MRTGLSVFSRIDIMRKLSYLLGLVDGDCIKLTYLVVWRDMKCGVEGMLASGLRTDWASCVPVDARSGAGQENGFLGACCLRKPLCNAGGDLPADIVGPI